jgi:hypothetical protein
MADYLAELLLEEHSNSVDHSVVHIASLSFVQSGLLGCRRLTRARQQPTTRPPICPSYATELARVIVIIPRPPLANGHSSRLYV